MMLAADIGGTNATLAIVDWDQQPKVVIKKTYATRDVKSISRLVDDFLSQIDESMYPAQGCVGVAGPVIETKSGSIVEMTNRNLRVSEKELRGLGLRRVRVVNDFVALGKGAETLGENEQKILHKGSGKGTIAVIGVGTGLGMGIVADGVAIASEGGHMELPLREGEEKFATFLRERLKLRSHELIEAEHALCGDGVERIYEYLAKKKLSAGEILSGKEALMIEAQQFFLVLLARVCRTLALCSYSIGGLYIGGGVVMKNTHLFDREFARQITAGNVFGLKDMHISVITNENTSLIGCAMILREREKK